MPVPAAPGSDPHIANSAQGTGMMLADTLLPSLLGTELLEGYAGEICQQCWLIQLAAMQLQDLLGLSQLHHAELATHQHAHRVCMLEAWQAVQTILASGEALSRLFWPSVGRPDVQARCAALRALFGVEDGSLHRSDRIRHWMDRFEADLGDWIAGHSSVGVTSDLTVTLAPAPGPGPASLRRLDPVRWTVSLLDEEYDLNPLIDEAARLQQVAAGLTR